MEHLNLTRLKRARYQKHMTVERAAEIIGKDRSTVWRYETGKTDIAVGILLQLLAAYEVSVVDVFDAGITGGGDVLA